MDIVRPKYLAKLISKMNNGRVKIITGIRRCGKSYLLFNLFGGYLRETGVKDDQIIELTLDEIAFARYRNPFELDTYIREKISDASKRYYVMIDEIQFVSPVKNHYIEDDNALVGFSDVILGLMKIKNADIYVTGSNSKMLSSDILTQFRDRGDEIRVNPLSYAEFVSAFDGDRATAWREYCTYGGMPYVMSLSTHEEKSKYLKDLFAKTYIKDVLERNNARRDEGVFGDLINILASSIGALTNPLKLSNTFASEKHVSISSATVEKYLGYFEDAFIIRRAMRYDVKGRKYIKTPYKYYFADVGLRNARLSFRQQEENHIMENMIYNELVYRGYDVDVGAVEYNTRTDDDKNRRIQLEIDFVANLGTQRYYIQSALNIDSPEKHAQEIESLLRVGDSFKKLVVVKEDIEPWRDEKGILYMGVKQFLLDESAMEIL